jgi:hypothetical protein
MWINYLKFVLNICQTSYVALVILFIQFQLHRENPELYLEDLRARYSELSDKFEQRKRQKVNGGQTNGNHGSSGGVGRGERLNAAQKERMRLLASAAYDRGKGEDTFGMKDEDWLVYNKMSKENDDDGNDDDESELVRIASKLQVKSQFKAFLLAVTMLYYFSLLPRTTGQKSLDICLYRRLTLHLSPNPKLFNLLRSLPKFGLSPQRITELQLA